MKVLLTVLLVFVQILVYGQSPPGSLEGSFIAKLQVYKATDTIPKVIYVEPKRSDDELIILIDEELKDEQVLRTIDPNKIANLKVKAKNVSTSHLDEIHVTMKESYLPRFITLSQLRNDYLSNVPGSILFLLDETVIKADYNRFMVDEKYILNILVEKVVIENERLDLHVVRLVTRTPANLDKANTIILR